MVTTAQLLTLAREYVWATKRGVTGVSRKAAGNEKTLGRLRAGFGANTKTVEKAAYWFASNWPDDTPWPHGIPRPQGRTQAGAQAGDV